MNRRISLLLPIGLLLAGCATKGPVLESTQAVDDSGPISVQLHQPVHFSTPEGASAVVPAGMYDVKPAGAAALQLNPSGSGTPLVVAADPVTHDIDLSAPFPLLLALNDDARNVVLLMPDGTALDAAGSLSGVQPRDIVRPRRHYQLAYSLDPMTGQIRFGNGATGQRPQIGKANISTGALVDAGKLGDLGPGDTESDFEIQEYMSNLNQAEILANNIRKKLDERFPLEENRDRPGGDYAQQIQPNATSCRTACAGDRTCQAFTFVKPHAGTSIGGCFLKRTVPAAVANSCCISGRRDNTVYFNKR
jgi:hypothetical protein